MIRYTHKTGAGGGGGGGGGAGEGSRSATGSELNLLTPKYISILYIYLYTCKYVR